MSSFFTCAGFALVFLTGCSAALRQDRAAKQLGIPKQIDLDLGEGGKLTAVLIPPGTFTMGAPLEFFVDDFWKRQVEKGRPHPFPPHKVSITQPFYMGKVEVTNRQFRQFVAETGYDRLKRLPDDEHSRFSSLRRRFKGKQRGVFAEANRPVSMVAHTWAKAFCKWLSRRSGRVVRLPTEAEWEYACRADTTGKYYFGPRLLRHAFEWNKPSRAEMSFTAWADPFPPPKPVGGKSPNPWGLYDMLGNVSELCSDWDGPMSAGPQTDPTGVPVPSRIFDRLVRGGSLRYPLERCYERAASAEETVPREENGFRVCMEVAKPRGVGNGKQTDADEEGR